MKYLIYFLFFQSITLAQVKSFYTDVEKTMQSIPENQKKSTKEIATFIKEKFTSEDLQIKAAYYYVISNVSYDINHQFTVNLVISDDEMVSKTIASKKGVCIHYARFFKDIITQLGYNCQVISGYTKQNNEIASLSHAWCAIKFKDEKWYVFDPTWDSGYIQKGGFVRSLNSKYFKVLPSQSVKSHMPFDYLWQFLNFPISEKEFLESNFEQSTENSFFDFEYEIENHFKSTITEQINATKNRLLDSGFTSKLVNEYFEILNKKMRAIIINTNIEKLECIVEEYNVAIKSLNEYVDLWNGQFKSKKKESEIKSMLDLPLKLFENCKLKLNEIDEVGEVNLVEFNDFKQTLNKTISETKKNKEFINNYLKTTNKREIKKSFSFIKE